MVAGFFACRVEFKNETGAEGKEQFVALGDGVSALPDLGVTFGGFSPTLMDTIENSKQIIAGFEAVQRQHKKVKQKQRELEFASTSKPKSYTDDFGNVWTYVVVNESVARITKCESVQKSIEIPASLQDTPVYAIGPEALSENNFVEEIVCADSIESIGACAFRLNGNLRRLVLPQNVTEFNESWVRHCPRLEELVLPGLLDEIKLHVFDNRSLRKLFVGKNVYSIEPGAFQNTALDEITIDEENPFIKTDGTGVYSKDLKTLYALARPVSHFKVADECVFLAKKSCYGVEALKTVDLPEGVEELDAFAFSHSGLEAFDSPGSLKAIGEKAFYYCKDLKTVNLNEGLLSIGDSAFEESGITGLVIPASIEHIGNSITARTDVVHSGSGCTLEIDPHCVKFFLDGAGGLYRRAEDGAHFVQLVDREAQEYDLVAEAVAIDPYAFAFHDAVRKVVVPDGVVSIGKNAFRICRNLSHIVLPDSVQEIGDEAFFDTGLEEFRVPGKLETLGKNALVTYGAHHGDAMPSLAHIEVPPENDRFYVVCGMLCRKTDKGSEVIVFTSSEEHVVFPEEIVRIEEYAFNNARGIDYLSLNPGIKTIGVSGLSTWCWIRHINVRLAEELEGRKTYDFFFPDTPKSIHGISQGIGGSAWVNVPAIMAQYDNCIVNARDYYAPMSSDNISAYEQAKLILGRMNDPIMLTDVNRGMFERLLRNYIGEICTDIARHDDRAAMDELVERGFINEDNLESIIARVGRLQDAAMTAYLLEVKRLRFNKAIIDFDL